MQNKELINAKMTSEDENFPAKKTARLQGPHVWMTLENYLSAPGKLCSYTAARGPYKDLVCGIDAINDDSPNQNEWRCNSCQGKVGMFQKRFNEKMGVQPVYGFPFGMLSFPEKATLIEPSSRRASSPKPSSPRAYSPKPFSKQEYSPQSQTSSSSLRITLPELLSPQASSSQESPITFHAFYPKSPISKKVYLPRKTSWMTLKTFIDRYEVEDICAFSPSTGRNSKKVCGGKASNTSSVSARLEYRCEGCLGKKGMIEHRVRIYLAKKEWEKLKLVEKQHLEEEKILKIKSTSKWISEEEFKDSENLCSYKSKTGKNARKICGAQAVYSEPSRCEKCKDKKGVSLSNPENPSRWISIEEYKYSSEKLCSYMPANSEKVCGAKPCNSHLISNSLKWRCENCLNLVGIIKKFYHPVPSPPKLDDWLDEETFLHITESEPRCSYKAKKGKNAGMYCGSPNLVETDGDWKNWRCASCVLKH